MRERPFRPPAFAGVELILEALQRSTTQARLARLAKRIGIDELMDEVETKIRARFIAEIAGRTIDEKLKRDIFRIVEEVLDEIARAGADA